MKILIVDDDPTSAKLLYSYLKEYGQCVKAADGEEALEEIRDAMEAEEPYDLICLDIMMPQIDGHETLKSIREFEQSTFNRSARTAKIVMTTALDDIQTVLRSYNELCDAYLTKPIRKEKLIKAMGEMGLVTSE